MNKIAITLFFAFQCATAFAQDKVSVIPVGDTAVKKNVKKVMPRYPGSIGEYLAKNLKIPRQVKGAEEIRFLVNTNGRLSQFMVINSLGADIDSAVINALKVMPKWKPATENGKPVAMWYNLPIGMGG